MGKKETIIEKEVLDKYSFNPNILKGSAGDFKSFVKDRYSKLKADEVSYLVEKFYGDK